jgi:hypothetical protein
MHPQLVNNIPTQVGCIPWDYPIPPAYNSTKHELTMCTAFKGDGHNNSLKIFEDAMNNVRHSQECRDECLQNCDETTYDYTIDTTELNTNTLCENKETKKVVSYLFMVKKTLERFHFKIALNLWRSTGSILTWLHKQFLGGSSHVITTNKVEDGLNVGLSKDICATTFKNDIAHMTIDFVSPRVLEVERNIKVTFPDMLGTVGN